MNSGLARLQGFWQKRVKVSTVFYILLAVISISVATRVIMELKRPDVQPVIATAQVEAVQPTPDVRFRMKNFRYAQPLLLSEEMHESKELRDIKLLVDLIIQNKKSAGMITSASVYLKTLNNNQWTSINPDEHYTPGSIIKVPVMMTFLRESEKNPELLKKKIYLDPSRWVPRQTFGEKRIQTGRSYTINELIYHMIVKSDNHATLLLNENMNEAEFKMLAKDLGLPEPDIRDMNYQISAKDYSKYLQVLYNASYLSSEDADYALSLLTETTFDKGMRSAVPAGIKMAHKFGQSGTPYPGGPTQLHESAIVFNEGNPFLITVMTKGNNVQQLPGVIAEITKTVFDKLNVTTAVK